MWVLCSLLSLLISGVRRPQYVTATVRAFFAGQHTQSHTVHTHNHKHTQANTVTHSHKHIYVTYTHILHKHTHSHIYDKQTHTYTHTQSTPDRLEPLYIPEKDQ